ncbi:MAG: hypothetical protein LUE98_04840 [Tannerellaceae bacterium]|nr:hypothetical protein [Tannerellaceae bacterium]
MKEKIILLSLYLGLLTACSDKYHDDGGRYTAEEMDISFLPQPSGAPANETGIEQAIEELDIIVCKDGKYQYHRSAWLAGGIYKTTLKAQQGVTLHFLANCRTILQEKQNLLAEGNNWLDNIRPYITDSYTSRTQPGITSLPMWGIKENIHIEEGTEKDLGPIWLVRAVAAVNVTVSVPATRFELKEAYLYFAPATGIVIPLSENFDDVDYVPEMPAGSTASEKYKAASGPVDNQISRALYLYENDAVHTGAGTNGKRRSRVVIGGYLDGTPPMTYYPLDFVKDNELVQVLRNHKYEFDVTSVSGKGYEDPDEASKAPAVNIGYGIYQWVLVEDRDIAIDGPYYLSLNRKIVELGPAENATATVSLTTNVPHEEISFTLEDIPATAGTQDVMLQAESTRYRVEMLNENGRITALRFTALHNRQTDNRETVKLTAGRIYLEVTINQSEGTDNSWVEGGDTNIDDRD